MNDALTLSLKNVVMLALAVTGCTVYIFFSVIRDVVGVWGTEEYSYAYFIAPLSLLLCLHRLSETPMLPRNSWLGIPLLFSGLALHIIGTISGVPVLPQYGLLLSIYGLVLGILGFRTTAAVAGPLAYLFFAIPLPTSLYLALSFALQLESSTLGASVLDILGVPVFQDGNIIDLGGYKLQVVEACSGLRYLFPLFSFSFLISYLYKGAFLKRLIIFLSAGPIAVIINVIRIAAVGLTVDLWGIQAAEGILHDFEGSVGFLICVALLLLEMWILMQIGKKGQFRLTYLSLPHGPYFIGTVKTGAATIAMLVSVILVSVGFATGTISSIQEIIPPHQQFSSFPSTIGDWRGKPQALDEQTLSLLKTTDYLNSDYTDSPNTIVNLFVAYYDSQRQHGTPHWPEMCIPGSGWKIASSTVKDISKPISHKNFSVNRLVIQKGELKQIVYFWFEQGGEHIVSEYNLKWRNLIGSLTRGRSEGGLVRLVTPISANNDEAEGDRRLQDFLIKALPLMQDYVPGMEEAPPLPAPPGFKL